MTTHAHKRGYAFTAFGCIMWLQKTRRGTLRCNIVQAIHLLRNLDNVVVQCFGNFKAVDVRASRAVNPGAH